MEDTIAIRTIRDLAREVRDIAAEPIQDERRSLWRRHNSLKKTRPPVICRPVSAWRELITEADLASTDPLHRQVEWVLRQQVTISSFGDDWVIEPCYHLPAVHAEPAWNVRWGLEVRLKPSSRVGGAWQFDPPMKEPEDIGKLVMPHHRIDEAATAQQAERVRDLIGDMLPVVVDRGPTLGAGLANTAAYLRGLGQLMWDLVERPQWVHELMRFLMEGVRTCLDEAEAAGDLRRINTSNQAQPYCEELPDPAADETPVARRNLWVFTEAQEFEKVSPAMHEEFLLRYQLPLIEPYALSAYGCCEDLTRKLDMLRKIPNLRRASVTPWTDLRTAVEKMGEGYVLSWRPNPTDMLCSFDPERVRRILREAMAIAGECCIEVYLKDIETVEGHPEHLREWTRVVREVVDEYGA